MGSNLESRLFEGLEDLFKEGLVSDALIAQSEKQAKEFWDLRENIPEANRRIGSISNHDISLPISLIPKFIQEMPTYMAHLADLRINCFGHLGDGNLHYNVFPPLGKNKNDYVHLREEIKTIIHDKINEFGGSVSAEHGIGRLKIDDLEKYGDPVKLIAMRSIKNAIDPKGIMNPGAVLRESK
jgi:FAD/FMN-containing dehydrogenase